MLLAKRELDEVLARFLIGDPPEFFKQFRDRVDTSVPFSNVMQSFQANLMAAIAVGSLPFHLSSASVHQRRFQQFLMAEKIRDLKSPIGGESTNPAPAFERSELLMDEFLKTPKGMESVRDQTVENLHAMLSGNDTAIAIDELLRQVAVMIWGAAEVAITDIAVELVNYRPELAPLIMDLERFKKSGISKGIPVEVLSEYGFNVSNSLGTIIFLSRRMDDFSTLREFCDLISGSSGLSRTIAKSSLYSLSQRRNLIVHRRGVVDKSYLEKTPDSQPIDTHLKITSDDIERYLIDVRDIGILAANVAEGIYHSGLSR